MRKKFQEFVQNEKQGLFSEQLEKIDKKEI
jgi:hypothetical protein